MIGTQRTPKSVYVVRHGESEANVVRIYQGSDSPLSEKGTQQAEFVAQRTRTLNAEVILSSPFPRALDTARAIERATGLPLEVHDLLRELLPPSALIGVPYESPEGQVYMRERILHHGDPDYRYGDEETFRELHERACTLLDLFERRPEHTLLVVTHAGFLRIIMSAMMTDKTPDTHIAGSLMRFLAPTNTGISVFTFDPDDVQRSPWRMVTFNDSAHLAETGLQEP